MTVILVSLADQEIKWVLLSMDITHLGARVLDLQICRSIDVKVFIRLSNTCQDIQLHDCVYMIMVLHMCVLCNDEKLYFWLVHRFIWESCVKYLGQNYVSLKLSSQYIGNSLYMNDIRPISLIILISLLICTKSIINTFSTCYVLKVLICTKSIHNLNMLKVFKYDFLISSNNIWIWFRPENLQYRAVTIAWCRNNSMVP